MAFIVALHMASARHIEQQAVDELARCWRSLRHEHGGPVSINYRCDSWVSNDCRLQVAQCPELTVESEAIASSDLHIFRTTELSFNFTLVLQHASDSHDFKLMIRDHVDQGFTAEGKIGRRISSRKRHLGSWEDGLNAVGSAVDPMWKGFAEMEDFGLRRDCTKEACPDRWAGCWPGSETKMLQIQVFIVLHKSFCDEFDSLAVCEGYMLGVFRDMNLIYENQIGISLRPAFFLSPDVFAREWPNLDSVESGKDGQAYLEEFSDQFACGGKFKGVIGRPRKDFGIFHIMFGSTIRFSQSAEEIEKKRFPVGRGFDTGICDCNAAGWSCYRNDGKHKKTWLILGHEIGHNFKMEHSFEKFPRLPDGGVDQLASDAGLMGYLDGSVNGVISLHENNRDEICSEIRKALVGKSDKSGCLHPYFGARERDPRFGEPYIVVFAIFVGMLVLVTICTVQFVFMLRRQFYLERRYTALKEMHHSDVAVLKNMLQRYAKPSNLVAGPKNHKHLTILENSADSFRSAASSQQSRR